MFHNHTIKSYHLNINKHKDRGAYKKRGAVFLYFDNFYSLILEDNIVFYLSFSIIYGNLLKCMYIAGTAQILQWKLRIVPLLSIFKKCILWSDITDKLGCASESKATLESVLHILFMRNEIFLSSKIQIVQILTLKHFEAV